MVRVTEISLSDEENAPPAKAAKLEAQVSLDYDLSGRYGLMEVEDLKKMCRDYKEPPLFAVKELTPFQLAQLLIPGSKAAKDIPDVFLGDKSPSFTILQKIRSAAFITKRSPEADLDLLGPWTYDALGSGERDLKDSWVYSVWLDDKDPSKVVDLQRYRKDRSSKKGSRASLAKSLPSFEMRMRKKVTSVGIVRVTSWIDVGSLVVSQAHWPPDKDPGLLQAPDSDQSIRSRPSATAKAIESMRKTRQPTSVVISQHMEAQGGFLALGAGDELDEANLKKAWVRKRDEEGWARRDPSGVRTLFNVKRIQKVCNDESGIVAYDMESNLSHGWRFLITSPRLMRDFRKSCLDNKASPKCPVYVDSTFQDGFYVTTLAFSDHVFESGKGLPFFNCAMLMLHERKAEGDYAYLANGLVEALGLSLADIQGGATVAAWATDGDVAEMNGLVRSGLFDMQNHSYCEIHLRLNSRMRIDRYPNLKMATVRILSSVYGSEETLNKSDRERTAGLCDLAEENFETSYAGWKQILVDDVEQMAGEDALGELFSWFEYFEEHQLAKIRSGYNPRVRAKFRRDGPGAVPGRVTTSALEVIHKDYHKCLENRPTVAEALGIMCRLIRSKDNARERALFSLGGTGTAGSCHVTAAFKGRYEKTRFEYLGMSEAERQRHVDSMWPPVAPKVRGLQPAEGLHPTAFDAAVELHVKPNELTGIHADFPTVLRIIQDAASIIAEGDVKRVMNTWAVMGPKDMALVSVLESNGPLPLICGLGLRCSAFRTTNKCICRHVLAVAHTKGPDFCRTFVKVVTDVSEKKWPVAKNTVVSTTAGRKGDFDVRGGHTVNPRAPEVIYPTLVERGRAALDDFFAHNPIFLPSNAQLATFAGPSLTLPREPFQNKEPFLITTVGRCGINDIAKRSCPACGHGVVVGGAVVDVPAPADLIIIHKERQMWRRGEAQGPAYPALQDPALMSSGTWYQEYEGAKKATGDYNWTRALVRRVYHARFACLFHRFPNVSKAGLILDENAKPNLNEMHSLYLKRMFDFP